jgi:hypothetical protein
MKPSGQVYENLVFNTWWTKASGNTSMSGEYQARGFLGDYQITVSANGQSKTINAVLTKDGKNNFEIRLP